MNDIKQHINRRLALQFVMSASALTVLGCSGPASTVGNFASGALGGSGGAPVNWGKLVEETRQGISIVADQTLILLTVQQKYLDVIGLKEDAAKVQAVIKQIESGNVNSVGFSAITETAESSNKAILVHLKKIENLDEQQKKELAAGLATHRKAIVSAWEGGLLLARVLLDARNAQKPAVTDLEAIKHAEEITTDTPPALNFLSTSKETYEKYAEAFEHEADIPLSANQRKLDLEPFSIS